MVGQGRVRGRTATWWPPSGTAAGRRPEWAEPLVDLVRRAGAKVREWVEVEVRPGRLVPWLGIGCGCGIAVYFAVDGGPAPWGAAALVAATATTAILARRRPFAFPIALGTAVIAAGFATATFKRAIIAHP